MKTFRLTPYRVCTLIAIAAISVLLAFGPADGGLVEVAAAGVNAEWMSGAPTDGASATPAP